MRERRGHTIKSEEPLFGLAVVGTVHPKRVLSNAGAQPVYRGLCGRADQVTRHGDASGHHDRHEQPGDANGQSRSATRHAR